MRWIFFIGISITIVNLLFAQSETKCILLLDENHDPVPFATVINLSGIGGAYTNENGYFYLEKSDSILIRHLSFYPLKLKSDEIKDTIVLKRKNYQLEPVTIYSSNSKKVKRHKFTKKYHLTSFPSFEIGTTISIVDQSFTNIEIPYKSSNFKSIIKLKLYTFKKNKPDQLRYEEIQVIPAKGKNTFISFSNDIMIKYQYLDTIFVSIEMLEIDSESEALGEYRNKSIALYFDFKDEIISTYATRNYDREKRWAAVDRFVELEKYPPTLIYFIKK